jgi:hypothetical protein
MALKAGSPGKGSRAQLTLELVGRVAMIRYKVLVQPVSHTKHFTCTICKLNIRYHITMIGQKICLSCIYFGPKKEQFTFRCTANRYFFTHPPRCWVSYNIVGRDLLFPVGTCPCHLISAILYSCCQLENIFKFCKTYILLNLIIQFVKSRNRPF